MTGVFNLVPEGTCQLLHDRNWRRFAPARREVHELDETRKGGAGSSRVKSFRRIDFVRGSRQPVNLQAYLLAPARKVNFSGAGRLPLLEAFAAKDWPSLRWLKRNSGLFAAVGTHCVRLHSNGIRPIARAHHRCPFGLASAAALWLILELFVVKEKLLSGREDEIGPAVRAFQYLVLEFH